MKEELYGLANHIAGAKGGLPQDWQDWANEIEMDLRKLANWEAQPVALVDRRPAASGGICWQNGGKDLAHGTELFTAPPAPAYPERLPCLVHLLPGLKFGKGVPTRSMLDALVRRAEYESEREAMTPEQKAEDDARIEAFKVLLPRPAAPAVPPEATPENIENLLAEITLFFTAGSLSHGGSVMFAEVWNACRAAMLKGERS